MLLVTVYEFPCSCRFVGTNVFAFLVVYAAWFYLNHCCARRRDRAAAERS